MDKSQGPCIYSLEHYSAIKKNEILPWDLEVIVLSEISQTEKDKYHDSTYMWNLTNKIKEQTKWK